MSRSGILRFLGAAACLAVLLPWVFAVSHAQQSRQAVAIDSDDIGGVVTGPNGPEAGVWVIAETRDLPVRYIKSVVTDDRGRYVVPDLPKANYSVWARGYGLVDSPKVTSEPGKLVNITATPAPNDAAAAHYYPAIYWYSMLQIPSADQFGGKGSDIPANLKQTDWLNPMKNNGCVGCHQLGQLSTRTIPAAFASPSHRNSAWMRRVQSGQAGPADARPAASASGNAPFKHFGDGPIASPRASCRTRSRTRPQGVERNIVVTLRDWMNEKHYLHDLIASDNAIRPSMRTARSTVRPSTARISSRSSIRSRTRRRRSGSGTGSRYAAEPGARSRRRAQSAAAVRLLGRREIWDTRVNNHNSMLDRTGQALAGRVDARPRTTPTSASRFGSSVGQAVPARAVEPASCGVRSQDRRSTRSSTPATARTTRSSASTATTRSGRAAAALSSAGSTPRCSTRQAMPRSRRAGRRSFSTRTAMAGATTTSSRINRSIPRRTNGSRRGSTP